MTDATEQRSSGLLDLPDEVLNLNVEYLRAVDRRRFVAACRRTAWVTFRASESRLRITKSTRFAGIKKATMLRCLVPQFIATACPQLAQLTIRSPTCSRTGEVKAAFTSEHKEAMAMASCSSLKHLTFDVCQQAPDPFMPLESDIRWFDAYSRASLILPPAYHTKAQLRRNLPNINTLVFKDAPNAVLIDTFATQLTRLEIEGDPSSVKKSLRHCSNLQHLRAKQFISPDNVCSLKVLDLACGVSLGHRIKILLQLPSLSSVRLGRLQSCRNLNDQPCSWQELHLDHLPPFTSLTNLNLRGIKKFSMGPDVKVQLPKPTDPESLAAVQQAADNLAHVGQIVLEECNTRDSFNKAGRDEKLSWKFIGLKAAEHHEDAAAAQLLTIASQRIGPVRTCDLGPMLHRPLLLRAVVDWGQTFIESVCLGYESHPSAHIWQELQQLGALKTITMWPPADQGTHVILSLQSLDIPFNPQLVSITNAVSDAALHYVIPAKKRLCLQYGIKNPYNVMHVMLLNNSRKGLKESQQQFLMKGQNYLQSALKDVLPAGSRLVSVDTTTSDLFYNVYSNYSWQFFWSVTLEPCTLAS